ncbi:hypothetical protein CRE_08884 [Caenorhabditis remanei]|uniref:Uncharacterized protein n=1 Tax=Caenorhabditis remanei TaxID=31234 RepID=E3LI14_CAERE|nr:hypothetical protein CRE_08884 [Caenorhabditis remanei]
MSKKSSRKKSRRGNAGLSPDSSGSKAAGSSGGTEYAGSTTCVVLPVPPITAQTLNKTLSEHSLYGSDDDMELKRKVSSRDGNSDGSGVQPMDVEEQHETSDTDSFVEGIEQMEVMDELAGDEPPALEALDGDAEEPTEGAIEGENSFAEIPPGDAQSLDEVMTGPIHKFARCFDNEGKKEEWPKDPSRKAVAKETLASMQAFRRMTWEAKDEPYAPPEDIDESKEKTQFGVYPMSTPYGCYQAVESYGSGVILTPCHREIVADDRPDLHALFMDDTALDTRSNRRLDLTDIHLSDVFFVEKIGVKKYAQPEDFIVDLAEAVDWSKHKFWQGKRVSRLQRITLRSEIAVLMPKIGTKKQQVFLVNNLPEAATAKTKIVGHHAKQDLYLAVDVTVPACQPGSWSRGYQPSFSDEEAHLRTIDYLLDVPHMLPVITKVDSLDPRRKGIMAVAPNFFGPGVAPTDTEFQRLQTVARLGIFTNEAMRTALYDGMRYRGEVTEVLHQNREEFVIQLQLPKNHGFPQKKWKQGVKVSIRFEEESIGATVIAATVEKDKALVRVRPLRSGVTPQGWSGSVGLQVFVKHQVEDPQRGAVRMLGIKTIPKYADYLPGMKMLAALHMGPSVPEIPDFSNLKRFTISNLELTQEQSSVIHLLSWKGFTACTLSCGPGSGKTTTIIGALVQHHYSSPEDFAVFVANSNSAVVQGAETLKRLDAEDSIHAVRLISSGNCSTIDEHQLSDIDYPRIWQRIIRQKVMQEDKSARRPQDFVISGAQWLWRHHLLSKNDLHNEHLRRALHVPVVGMPEQPRHSLMEVFFRVYKPKVVFGTIDSVRQIFKREKFLENWTHHVKTVMVDESSQVGRHSIINLAYAFPSGRFLLVGDEHQLPPYGEHGYPEELYKLHNGPIFKDAVSLKLLPNLRLSTVYRCPKQSVDLLANLYYEGQLKPYKDAVDTCPILKDLGLPSGHPTLIINTKTMDTRVGTSWCNMKEAEYAAKIAKRFIASSHHPRRTIAVLGYFLPQVHETAARMPNGVFVSTVDASQGREFDVVVLMTTRGEDFKFSGFLCSPERFTVAVSRHKQALIVLCNTDRMKNVENWKALCDDVKPQSTVDADRIAFLRDLPK